MFLNDLKMGLSFFLLLLLLLKPALTRSQIWLESEFNSGSLIQARMIIVMGFNSSCIRVPDLGLSPLLLDLGSSGFGLGPESTGPGHGPNDPQLG